LILGGTGRTTLVAVRVSRARPRRAAAPRKASPSREETLRKKCSNALLHIGEERCLMTGVCRILVQYGGYAMAWVGTAEADVARSVRPVARFGMAADYLDHVAISWGDGDSGRGPTGSAIRSGQVQVNADFCVNDKVSAWRQQALAYGMQSSIAVPLVYEKQVLGVLNIYALQARAFGRAEVRLLQELGNELAFGIHALRMRQHRLEAERTIDFLGRHDALTGLPNRLWLQEHFERHQAGDAGRCALLFLDLDDFRQINDVVSFDIGDQLLVRIVERIALTLRDGDILSRQGGDEFTIVLAAVEAEAPARAIAERLQRELAEPFELYGYSFNISASIGISLYPEHGDDVDTLLKRASTALRYARRGGRGAVEAFSSQMNTDALARMLMHNRLRDVVRKDELLLHYQPQIDLRSGRLVGMEALVRWNLPGEGLVPPAQFIPLAEETGIIIPIGRWVMHEACRQASAWFARGLAPLTVAVNLSVIQFNCGDLVGQVREALAQSGLAPHCLELELTESILLHDTEAAMRTMCALKEMGVKLSIDDFGTGYSSLAYLKRLAVDKLKIDRSFVCDLGGDAGNEAIVQAIIQLGKTLQLSIIAEGVETEGQLQFLARHGCDEAQGYFFSQPLAAEQFYERYAYRAGSAPAERGRK
jgi:diguanylate cyclase (GGDEF)-like protein